MLNKDIVIIGGGASGLMCALSLVKRGKNVTILEGSKKVGKKILVSGNGRCNLTNANISSNNYNQEIPYFNKCDNNKTLDIFHQLGLVTMSDKEGRYYPISNHSSSVLDVICNQLGKCEIITDCMVDDITKSDGFTLHTSNGEYHAKKVVVATGGNSMCNILDNLNVEYNPFVPSLCGLTTLSKNQLISGIRVDAQVTLKIEDDSGQIHRFRNGGEVIFKDRSISGICIFDMSFILNRFNVIKKDGVCCNATMSLDLFKQYDMNGVVRMLNERKTQLYNLKMRNFFDGMFHKNLGLEILNRCAVDINDKVSDISIHCIKNMARVIKNFEFVVTGCDNNNQVHHGGVRLDKLNEDLQYIDIPNLYFCGEICDVDGKCGGYNLQWAWTSGYIVGESI